MARGFGELGRASIGVDAELGDFEREITQLRAMTEAFAEGFKEELQTAANMGGGALDGALRRSQQSTRRATAGMAGDFDRFSGISTSAIRNISFQVTDMIVGLQAGQRPLTVLIQQGSQLAAGFGTVGVVAGGVIAALGALASIMFNLNSRQEELADGADAAKTAIDSLSRSFDFQTIKIVELIEKYVELESVQRRQTQLELADNIDTTTNALASQTEIIGEMFRELQAMQQQFRILEQVDPIQIEGLQDQIDLIDEIIRQIERARSGEAPFEEVAQDIVVLLQQAEGLGSNMGELTTKLLEASRAMIQLGVTADQTRDALEAVGKVEATGARILSPEPFGPPPPPAPDRRARAPEPPTAPLPAPRPGIQGPPAPGTPEAAVFEEEARGRAMTVERTREHAEAQAEVNAELERQRRIEAGSRLPDDLDMASVAAGELAATLTDINNLSFESLLESFGQILQRIAQMIIEAMIFRTIMSGLGGGAAAGGDVGTQTGSSAAFGVFGRQSGGHVFKGQTYMVGEGGAELFSPSTGGEIVPLDRVGGGGDYYDMRGAFPNATPGAIAAGMNAIRDAAHAQVFRDLARSPSARRQTGLQRR